MIVSSKDIALTANCHDRVHSLHVQFSLRRAIAPTHDRHQKAQKPHSDAANDVPRRRFSEPTRERVAHLIRKRMRRVHPDDHKSHANHNQHQTDHSLSIHGFLFQKTFVHARLRNASSLHHHEVKQLPDRKELIARNPKESPKIVKIAVEASL
jgi:hypothetical protein